MQKKKNSRKQAAEILTKWIEEKNFPDRELARVSDGNAFVMEVVYGVVRSKNILEWILQGMLQKEPQPFFKALLYVGLYQILFMDQTEEYAAVHETVEAAKYRPQGAGNAPMINAVLRRAQREKEDIFQQLRRQPAEIRLSHPDFLLQRWQRQFGEIDAKKLAEWNNRPPETFLRVNTAVITEGAFLGKMNEAGIDLQPHPLSGRDHFYLLPRGIAVQNLPGYEEGWFGVQDPATSAAVDLLRPLPGESILDACAAPGGKTAMMAGRMKGEGKIVAMDLHADRLPRLRENVQRLQLKGVDVLQGDATRPEKAVGSQRFDAILLDVPCLNTGVIRRRPDARWRVNTNRLKAIKEVQYAILDACAKLLNPGGRIVYSTCSLEPEENEDLVGRWIRETPGFFRAKAKKLFPPKSQTDGAFAALLRKED